MSRTRRNAANRAGGTGEVDGGHFHWPPAPNALARGAAPSTDLLRAPHGSVGGQSVAVPYLKLTPASQIFDRINVECLPETRHLLHQIGPVLHQCARTHVTVAREERPDRACEPSWRGAVPIEGGHGDIAIGAGDCPPGFSGDHWLVAETHYRHFMTPFPRPSNPRNEGRRQTRWPCRVVDHDGAMRDQAGEVHRAEQRQLSRQVQPQRRVRLPTRRVVVRETEPRVWGHL